MNANSPNQYTKIRKYILTSMILAPFIPFVVILAIGYFYFATALTSASTATMQRIAGDHRQMIEAFLLERQSDLEFVLYSNSYEKLCQSAELAAIYENLLKKSDAFTDLGVFDATGLHIAYVGLFPLAGKVYKDADWFVEVINNGYYISDVFLGYRNIPHFIIAVARKIGNHQIVIRATIDTFVFNSLVENVRIGKTGEAYILNHAGMLQTDRRSGGEIMLQDQGNHAAPVLHDGLRIFIQKDPSGQQYLYATTWMINKKWMLVVRQEKDEAYKTLRTAVYLIIMVAVLGGGAIVATSYFLTARIVARIKHADSEKGRLQEQLIRAGRLAELGEMAAGFAHEINNPLQIIKSEQALIEAILEDFKLAGMLKKSDDLVELEDSIGQIALQIDRCAKITHAILKFGRKSETQIQRLHLDQFIPEIMDMVNKKAQVQGIRVEQNIADNTPPIDVDPAQLQQVLLNLSNNAIDAIGLQRRNAGGRILIETAAAENNRARITVSDNGCGIDSENLQKMFTPFFSTKPVGQGTGLGLSICYGIITGMGGKMAVDSQPGAGATFEILLPATG